MNIIENQIDIKNSVNRNVSHDINEQLTNFVGIIASFFMIFGGIVPYIPQYRVINRSRSASGFSTLVCLALLIANILRILFWFGHPFEIPLLIQSVVMIICMLIMLELCIRIKNETIRSSSMLAPPEKKFLDFEKEHFWKWTDFKSYIQFLLSFVIFFGFFTSLLISSTYFIETLGNFNSKILRDLNNKKLFLKLIVKS